MSQQHATSANDGSSRPQSSAGNGSSTEPTATNTSSAIINLDDTDDEDGDGAVQFVGVVRPSNTIIDLCMSPSTSAAAAAAAASNTTTGETLKTANNDAGAAAGTGETSAASGAATLECPICLQTCIHPARLPCGHIFCFLCVKGVAYKNRRCAMCRREIPAEFLDHPQLVNGIDDICVTRATDDGYQWYYEGRNGWWQYDDRTSQDIEETYKKGEKSCTILVAGYVYIVDLENLVQQRQNEPNRCRRVKRDLANIPKKGVAGLRIEGNIVISDPIFTNGLRLRSNQQTTNNTTPAVNFISTIAATDAAIRIASDIIGSTLAHADELTRGLTASNISDSASDLSGEHANNYTIATTEPTAAGSEQLSLSQGNVTRSLASSHSSSIQDLMRSATEDLLDTTQQVIETNQHTIDLFEQALNDFQALSLRNFEDSSDEEDNDENVRHPNEMQSARSPSSEHNDR